MQNIRAAYEINKAILQERKRPICKSAKKNKLAKEDLEKANRHKYILREAKKSRVWTLQRLAEKRARKKWSFNYEINPENNIVFFLYYVT